MRNVLFGVKPDTLKNLVERIEQKNPDRTPILVPFVDVVTKAPTGRGKNKDYHQIKITALIPKDAIKGENAILDFGGFVFMDIDSRIVADHLKGGE
ncbi:hypothetical protein BTO30_15025 [Domibacillus antri]|uniref:Uncharacterized protein n=1 Tax=Domibacillus antri TaxID=1714264 RepID=A0A1Q8Q283_9BACI|nr:hypothetical protein [Domibacillus antri]OLN21427.1 hypothetical protein BTO30_15025 [Domibacillus antri]